MKWIFLVKKEGKANVKVATKGSKSKKYRERLFRDEVKLNVVVGK